MIIGFAGKRRVGKDTSANYLVNAHGYKRFAFADVLKSGCMTLFDLTEEQVNGDLKEVIDERWGVTPRYILQHMGTDVLRKDFGKDFFVDRARSVMQPGLVISDVRFGNEADLIHDFGGIVIRLQGREETNNNDTHVSEAGLDHCKIDYEVLNDGSIADLHSKVEQIRVSHCSG